MFAILGLVVSVLAMPGGLRAAAPAVEVTVDLDRRQGPFHPLSGVQGSPLPIVEGDVDQTRAFRDCSVAWVRFPQDCRPNTLTLSGIFPDGGADPDDPASYRFAGIDRHVAAARAAGCRILWQASYDVGGSDGWVGPNLGGRPIADLDLWCRVLRGCLEHFEGRIDLVEFVNEPTGLGGFGKVPPERLMEAFCRFLAEVASYNGAHPERPVTPVGPGVPLGLEGWARALPRYEAFLAGLGRRGLSLPVFSYHHYGADMSLPAFEELARRHRALLDRHGMRATRLWNSEWQATAHVRSLLGIEPGILARSFAPEDEARIGAGLATYAVAAKLRCQGILDGSIYYRANLRPWPRLRELMASPRKLAAWVYFNPYGPPGPLARHEQLLAEIGRRTPTRCLTTLAGGTGTEAALGCRDEALTTVSLTLCNLATSPRPFVVRLRSGGPLVPMAEKPLWSLGPGGLVGGPAGRDVILEPGADGVRLSTVLPPLTTRVVVLGRAPTGP